MIKLMFAEQAADPGDARQNENDPVLRKTKEWLEDYFAGLMPDISTIPLALEGTPFQMLVWQELLKVPYGSYTTYGKIAKKIAALMGKTGMSAQAVGGAVGRNPVWIIVPCHRVLGADKSLTGYAGGIDRKKALLDIEKVPYKV